MAELLLLIAVALPCLYTYRRSVSQGRLEINHIADLHLRISVLLGSHSTGGQDLCQPAGFSAFLNLGCPVSRKADRSLCFVVHCSVLVLRRGRLAGHPLVPPEICRRKGRGCPEIDTHPGHRGCLWLAGLYRSAVSCSFDAYRRPRGYSGANGSRSSHCVRRLAMCGRDYFYHRPS